jgi:sodium-coupled neutral amino acid transporter 11
MPLTQFWTNADPEPVALITCDLGVTLEITGGVSATALAYIFPAACYLKLSDPKVLWYSRAKLPATVCLAFGLIAMVVSMFQVLQRAYTPMGEPKMCMT